MKRLFLISLLCLPFAAHAGLYENTGFVPGNVWIAPSTFFAGDTVSLYTVLFNGDKTNLTGTVTFFDGASPIASQPFALTAEKPVLDVSSTWKATPGNHSISVALSSFAGGLRYASSSPIAVFVDTDTDHDGIGDLIDPDIDGDGLSNSEEARLGTNPSKPDTDGDGMTDGQEVAQGTNPRVTDPVLSRIEHASTTLGKIEAATVPVANGMETLRQKVDSWVDTTSSALEKQIAAASSSAALPAKNSFGFTNPQTVTKDTSSMPTPFALLDPKTMLAGLGVLDIFTSSSPLFYTLLFVITLLVVRILFRIMNRRHE